MMVASGEGVDLDKPTEPREATSRLRPCAGACRQLNFSCNQLAISVHVYGPECLSTHWGRWAAPGQSGQPPKPVCPLLLAAGQREGSRLCLIAALRIHASAAPLFPSLYHSLFSLFPLSGSPLFTPLAWFPLSPRGTPAPIRPYHTHHPNYGARCYHINTHAVGGRRASGLRDAGAPGYR